MLENRDNARGQTSHISQILPINRAEPITGSQIAASKLYAWLAPYDKRTYPGRGRLLQRFAPGFALVTIRHWLRGRYNPPISVYRHWLEVLTGQEERIADLKRELVDEIARLENRPKRVPHFEAVRRKRLERPREP